MANWKDLLPPYNERPISAYGTIVPKVLVIHQTTGDMDDGSDAVAYMFSRNDGIRWHWTVGADGTAWRHGDFTDMMAHALGINSISVGIEHDMPVTATPPEAMYETSARIAAAFCRYIGRAPSRDFIIGHDEDHRYGGTSTHTDPGDLWDWDHYMDLVRGVYEGDDAMYKEFKAGWLAFRRGDSLPADASADFGFGFRSAQYAAANPAPGPAGEVPVHHHPHTHVTGPAVP
jgi:N-acetyl-anhydromuramyl-L-alanine amidase AmpD